MKLATLIGAVLLATTATNASGAGVNFAWNSCFGEGTGVSNKNFACASNDGSQVAVGSFVAPTHLVALQGYQMIIDLQSAGSALPPWWQFRNIGTCRQISLSANFVGSPANQVCVDPYAGGGVGTINLYSIAYKGNPTRAHLDMISANTTPGPIDANVEYAAFNVVINNAKTVGTGACAGCATPVCLVLNNINLIQSGVAGDFRLTQAANPGSNYITWQGGAVGGLGCPAATPTRNSTWGSVKSLYR